MFLASYLRETRDVLVRGRVPRISLKHLGPLLLIWGLAMVMLILIRDLGSSVMFFGALPGAALRGHRAGCRWWRPGWACSWRGACFFAKHVPHVHDRVTIWLHPFRPDLVNGRAYQIAQWLFAQADGGLFGTRARPIAAPAGGTEREDGTILPAAKTDLIYAVITNELGLFGAVGVILHLPAARVARLQDRDDRP